MTQRQVIDVSALPDHAFGSRSIMWWATMGIIAVEGTVFALVIASYFYIQGNESAWPPPDTAMPGLFWPTVNVLILLASLFPNQKLKTAAEEQDLRKVRVWMVIADLFAAAFLAVRVLEYARLNVSWDSNAYGSVTWTLLSLHTVHLVIDFFDTIVLTVMMFTRHGHEPRRFVDVDENCFYWYFVVVTWIPVYAVLYWAPRLL